MSSNSKEKLPNYSEIYDIHPPSYNYLTFSNQSITIINEYFITDILQDQDQIYYFDSPNEIIDDIDERNKDENNIGDILDKLLFFIIIFIMLMVCYFYNFKSKN
jgi:hypothetical protein